MMRANASQNRQSDPQRRTKPPSRKANQAIDKRAASEPDISLHRVGLRREIECEVRESIDVTLIGFGLEEGDRKELQADLRYLRSLRKRSEQVEGFILKGIVTCALTCCMGVAWIGLKTAIGH